MLETAIKEVKYLIANKSLIKQFIKRDITQRYKGSYLGILWSLITPMIMLTIYTFVFSVIFNARWGTAVDSSKIEFAMVLFAGLIVFNIFSEVVSRAPTLVLSNPNYVKKIIFPLEILPLVNLGSALFNAGISLLIILIVILFNGEISWTVLLFPIVIFPFCLIILGISWFLSSLGVYIRDIAQFINLLVSCLMFLSPIFYPISSIPENLRFIFLLNPISYAVEDTRRVILWGELPHWNWLGIELLIGIVVASLGYIWFKKTRKGFADVI